MRGPESSSVWVVCPAFNEATAIGGVLSDLSRTDYHVVVVDDCSCDATRDIATELGATVISHPINLGQGAALKTGIGYALSQGAAYIVTFDADGQHRVGDIPRLLDALDHSRADFALGSRFLTPSPIVPIGRRLLLKAATLFTVAMTGLRLTDTHDGLRAFTRRGASVFHLRQNRMAHASEILGQIARSGLRYVEVPVTIEYTPYTMAKGQRAGDLIMVLLDLFAQRLYR
jgi:glycosyltransferase involved in cell wall biosynthesis